MRLASTLCARGSIGLFLHCGLRLASHPAEERPPGARAQPTLPLREVALQRQHRCHRGAATCFSCRFIESFTYKDLNLICCSCYYYCANIGAANVITKRFPNKDMVASRVCWQPCCRLARIVNWRHDFFYVNIIHSLGNGTIASEIHS